MSARLGHASIQITLDTYSHILPEMDQEAASAVAQLILGDQAGVETTGEAPGEGLPPVPEGSTPRKRRGPPANRGPSS